MIPSCVYGFEAGDIRENTGFSRVAAFGPNPLLATANPPTSMATSRATAHNFEHVLDTVRQRLGRTEQSSHSRHDITTRMGSARGSDSSFYPPIIYSVDEKPREPLGDTLRRAGKRALGGGLPGAGAMVIQVFSLLWLRSTINYQYRYGTTTTQALKTLYRDGGIPRFYRGLGPALLQGPLSRFGDTAANAGTLALLDSYDSTASLPVGVKTLAASTSAAGFRILLMPIDACKTIMQVEGKGGFGKLVNKVRVGGPTVLFHGALAASSATLIGHWPWFYVYNTLNEMLPQYDELPKRLLRSAVIGFSASAISDTCSNSVRVVKTSKQASTTKTTYPAVVREIVGKEGLIGLFGRGLKTKILANGLQGLMFTVLWRIGQDMWIKKEKEAEARK